MAMSGSNHQDSGDPLQSGDAYKKKNLNRLIMMIFGLAVLFVIGYVAIAHLYFAKPDGANKIRSAPSILLVPSSK